LSWSPDGKRIAVSDTDQPSGHFRILQIDVETRQQRIIQAGFSEVLDCVSPAFSPDGRVLAFIGEKSGGVRDIYIVSSDSRVPRQLTSDETVGDIAWTKDGEEILFSSGKYISDSRIWRMSVSGRKRELLPEIGRGAIQPAVSRDGLRLAYTRYVYESNVWRYDTRGLTQPVRFIESTWIDENPSYSLDGRYIAFISDRSGSAELWRCNSDGSSPIQLTSFHGPSVGYPSWSPDGSQIAFDSNARGRYGIHVVNADGGAVRRLVADSHLNARPSWSRDGKWIYYQSDRSGTMQIWKMSVVGEAYPVQVTRDGGYSPTVSTDGHHIYYSRGPGRIFRISTDGSEDTSIMHSIQPATLSDWPYWGLAQAGIYFADPQGMNWSMKYFEFRSGHVNPLFGVQEPAIGPPAISPDGRWLLYAQVDQVGSDLMLVENFR